MEENSTLERGEAGVHNIRKANFQMHLLFTEKPEIPTAKEIRDIFEKYLGGIQIAMNEEEIYAFTLDEYAVPKSEGKVNAKVILTKVFTFQSHLLQENYVNEEYINSFHYDIFMSDLLTSSFSKEEQYSIRKGMLQGIIEVFPVMSAIWICSNNKMIFNKEFPMLSDEEIEKKIIL
ncbi:MAG: hypothetical protein Q4F05_06865 [bacterium]|nr:hypothetical protein [bacterium]